MGIYIITLLIGAILVFWALMGNGGVDFMETKAWHIMYIIIVTPMLIISIMKLFKH